MPCITERCSFTGAILILGNRQCSKSAAIDWANRELSIQWPIRHIDDANVNVSSSNYSFEFWNFKETTLCRWTLEKGRSFHLSLLLSLSLSPPPHGPLTANWKVFSTLDFSNGEYCLIFMTESWNLLNETLPMTINIQWRRVTDDNIDTVNDAIKELNINLFSILRTSSSVNECT